MLYVNLYVSFLMILFILFKIFRFCWWFHTKKRKSIVKILRSIHHMFFLHLKTTKQRETLFFRFRLGYIGWC